MTKNIFVIFHYNGRFLFTLKRLIIEKIKNNWYKKNKILRKKSILRFTQSLKYIFELIEV